MNAKLLNLALAAALGFAAGAPLYAADTVPTLQGTRTSAWSDADVTAALAACRKQTGSEQSKCIANIRPTEARGEPTTGDSANPSTVKDGTAVTDEEYSAAVKECQSADNVDKDRCINAAKEHFGRM